METKLFNILFAVIATVWFSFTSLMACMVVDYHADHTAVNKTFLFIWVGLSVLIIVLSLIFGNRQKAVDEFEYMDDPYAIPLQHNSTCKSCKDWWCCSYVGDLYNTNGDCIDEK